MLVSHRFGKESWGRRDDSSCDLLDGGGGDIVGNQLKMYRLGEYDLSICLDRTPAHGNSIKYIFCKRSVVHQGL